ncbi:MAG: glutamate racemase [Acidobacteriota bacterium]
MSQDSRPIGVFDSGIGGLTVVAALRARLPAESVLYLGDTARLPYGTKSPQTVQRYTGRNLDFLVERGVKAAVVACNTASALALPQLRPKVPTWGVVEPGAIAADTASVSGRIGVLGTESTIASGAYAEAIHARRPEAVVVSKACPLFVPLVEEGWWQDEITEQVARRYLEPLKEQSVDTVVLGCTHYPLLVPVLRNILGPGVALVDSAAVIAEHLALELERSGSLAAPRGDGADQQTKRTGYSPEDGRSSEDPSLSKDHYCVTDAAPRFERIAASVLGVTQCSLELVDI